MLCRVAAMFGITGWVWLLFGISFAASSGWATTNAIPTTGAASAREGAEAAYITARSRFEIEPENVAVAWEFARAAFDWAEFAKNNKEREQIALQGIAAARRAIVLQPQSAAAHYYLGMNLGQLARTRSIGALKLVDEMEQVFKKARSLDKNFDFAGPDRNLGLLYLEAPSTFSVGDKKKARLHLTSSAELSPNYPENCLNVVEAYLRWGELTQARTELEQLEKILPAARKEFSSEKWKFAWQDWDRRHAEVQRKLRPSTRK